MKVYLGSGHATDALNLMQSKNLGLGSRFAKQDPQLISALLLEAYVSSTAWHDAFAHCKCRLSPQEDGQATIQNDEQLWELLTRSAKALKDPALVPMLLRFLLC